MDITRRSLVGTAAGLTACAALGLNAAAAVAATPEGQPIYEGSARGMRGHITVHVTLGGDRIVGIQVVGNTETPRRLSDAAVASMVPAMLEYQTVQVDGVTGATFSSMALANAVSAALEAAGVAERFSGEVSTAAVELPADNECDVLVVGGGLAGCSAAVAASYSDYGVEPSGLRVILVEEQGLTGGSSMLSGGAFRALQPLHDGSNLDKLFEDEYPTYYNEGYPVDKDLAYHVLETSRLNAFQNLQLGHGFLTNPTPMRGFKDPLEYVSLKGKFMCPRPFPTVFTEGVWSFAGYKNMEFMDRMVERAEVEVRLNTEAVELLVENGFVAGAKVETPAGSYDIHAKKVILATGGFSRNPELMATYAPSFVNGVPYSNAGCQGDAVALVEPLGGYVDGFDDCNGPLGPNGIYGGFNDLGYDFDLGINFPIGFGCVVVNSEGRRFVRDSANMPYDEGPTPRTVAMQPEGVAWAVFDSANTEAVQAAEGTVMQANVYRANSVAELAEAMGISAEALEQTIEAYNATQAFGADDTDFGVPNADMVPVAEAPFYAVDVRGTVCITNMGVHVGDRCEVVNADGEVIPNLYVVGEAGYFGHVLNNLGICLATGRLAGDSAREALRG